MGVDKGLLKLHSITWAQTALEKMAKKLQLPAVLSVNSNQYNYYSLIFTPDQLIKDIEGLPIGGPLCGVLSVHFQYPEEDLMALACDMPLMDPTILTQLLTVYSQRSAHAFVFTNEGNPEPLCAIYTAKGLSIITSLLHANQLTKYSMKYALEHINTFLIPLTEDQKKYFLNFNTPAELNGM